jgi:hypothetical protein
MLYEMEYTGKHAPNLNALCPKFKCITHMMHLKIGIN